MEITVHFLFVLKMEGQNYLEQSKSKNQRWNEQMSFWSCREERKLTVEATKGGYYKEMPLEKATWTYKYVTQYLPD